MLSWVLRHFFERDRILSEEIEDGIKIKGSRQHMHQVLDILLGNAQKYSQTHSEVLITLRSVHSHHCEQVVRDHKGKIWAESQNGINRFFVELPRE